MDDFNKAERELLCQKCGCEYPIWYCENFIWNPVVEHLEAKQNTSIHFLCLNCFAFICERIVLEGNSDCKIIWKLDIGSRLDAKIALT